MEHAQGAPAAEVAGNVTDPPADAQRQAKKARKRAEHAAEVAAARAAGATERNAVLSAILASDKVKGREVTALKLAIASPAMSADEVIAFVAALPAGASHASIAERLGSAGAALTLGAPTEAVAAAPSRDRVVERINARRSFK